MNEEQIVEQTNKYVNEYIFIYACINSLSTEDCHRAQNLEQLAPRAAPQACGKAAAWRHGALLAQTRCGAEGCPSQGLYYH